MAAILLILQLLPAIISLVNALEVVFKGSSISGAAKKQVLLDALAGSDQKTVAVASKLADSVVGTFNKTGVFSHGVDVAPEPPKPA